MNETPERTLPTFLVLLASLAIQILCWALIPKSAHAIWHLLPGQLLGMLGLVVGLTLHYRLSPREFLGLRSPGGGLLLIGLLIGLVSVSFTAPLQFLLQQFVPALGQVRDYTPFLAGSPLERGLMLGAMAVGAPLFEELLFRGYLQEAWRRSLGLRLATLLSGGLFAAFHLQLEGLLSLLLLGLLFARLRALSGSVWPSVLAHAGNNGLAVLLILAKLDLPQEAPAAASPPWGAMAGLGVGGLITLLGLFLLFRRIATTLRSA